MKEEGRIRQPFEVEAKARLDLLESASPPPGYEINRVLLMTYGLDAGVALAILACTHGVAQQDIDIDSGNFDLPKMEQSRFIKKVLNRTLILAQQSDSAPRRIENIRSDLGELLQDRFLSIAKPRKSTTGKSPWINFHPKLAIFTFQRGSDAILRILIGSKNLTLGSALESAVQLEFRAKMNITEGEKDQGMARVPGGSRVLNSLSHYLSQVLEKGISESHHDTKLIMRHVQEVKNWVAELKRFAKTHKHIFADKRVKHISLHGQVPGGTSIWKALAADAKKARRMVIVSPWIDAEAVKFSLRFRPRAKNLVFWTLASERQKLHNFSGLASALATEASSDIYESQELGDEDEMHRELRLHAKLTAIDQSNGKGIIWLGSGNWTCPGIGLHRKNEENFELMVRVVLDSQATSWLGDIDTDLITDEEMVGDEESEDSETVIIKNRRLLIRLQLSWKVYPSSLYVRLLLRKGEKAVLKSKFKWLDLSALESSTFHECPKLIRLGRCSWSKLLRNGFEVLEVPISKDSILQSLISVTSDLGTEGGSVRIHVPAPDSVARRRSERVNERIHIDLVDILESLLSLQEGVRGRRSKISLRHGKRKEYSANIDDYFRYLRLELIYLQIARDDEDADNKYERARDVLNELQLFTKHPGNNHRTDIQALIRDLEYVIEQARTMRRARAK